MTGQGACHMSAKFYLWAWSIPFHALPAVRAVNVPAIDVGETLHLHTHFLNKQTQRCKVWPQVISSPSPEIPVLNSRLSQRVQVIMHTSPVFWWTGSVVSNLPASIFRPLATFLLLRSIQHCNFPPADKRRSKEERQADVNYSSIPMCDARTKAQK